MRGGGSGGGGRAKDATTSTLTVALNWDDGELMVDSALAMTLFTMCAQWRQSSADTTTFDGRLVDELVSNVVPVVGAGGDPNEGDTPGSAFGVDTPTPSDNWFSSGSLTSSPPTSLANDDDKDNDGNVEDTFLEDVHSNYATCLLYTSPSPRDRG